MTDPACAILDLDGTLHPGRLGMILLHELVRDGSCDSEHVRGLVGFVRGTGPDELHTPDRALRAYQLYAQATEGVSVELVRQAAKRVWERERAAMFPCVVAAVAALRARAYRTVLISGSPDDVVRVVAADLRIDLCRGAEFAMSGGVYAGKVVTAPGVLGGKVDVLRNLLGEQQIDFTRSVAIGNSASDVGILSMVGRPVAFEPDEPLRAVAVRHGWPIADRWSGLPENLTGEQ